MTRRLMRLGGAPVLALALGACAPTAHRVLAPELARASAAGLPMLIYALGVPGQIQVGFKVSVPVYVQFVVTAKEPLRSVRFYLAGYSPRGLPVLSHKGGQLQVVLDGPGPFDPQVNYEVNSFHSQPAGFPGGDVTCVELNAMEVTYTDGRKETFAADLVAPLLVAALRRECGDNGPQVNSMAFSTRTPP